MPVCKSQFTVTIGIGLASFLSTVVVVIQFLSGVAILAEIARFTLFLLQLLALRLSTLLDSGHPPSPNQSSWSLSPLASFRFFSVVFAFSCHSLQDPEQPSKHYHLTPFTVANWSIVYLNSNISICSSVVFLSTTF